MHQVRSERRLARACRHAQPPNLATQSWSLAGWDAGLEGVPKLELRRTWSRGAGKRRMYFTGRMRGEKGLERRGPGVEKDEEEEAGLGWVREKKKSEKSKRTHNLGFPGDFSFLFLVDKLIPPGSFFLFTRPFCC